MGDAVLEETTQKKKRMQKVFRFFSRTYISIKNLFLECVESVKEVKKDAVELA